MVINIHERAILSVLSAANGRVTPEALVAGYKQQFGLRDGRTRGVTAMIESCLLTLQKKGYISIDQGGEKAVPAHRHRSVIGRDVKVSKIGCCVPSKTELERSKQVKSYRCAFFSITTPGRKALEDTSRHV